LTWQRVVVLAILVVGSIVADAIGSKELAYMFAGAAAGVAVPGRSEDGSRKLGERPRRKTLPPLPPRQEGE
jgi:hypothetical protein